MQSVDGHYIWRFWQAGTFSGIGRLGIGSYGHCRRSQAESTRLASILERFSSFNPEKGHRVRATTAISSRLFVRGNQSILPDIGYRNGSLVDSILLPS